MIVVDTLGQFAKIEGDAENSAGAALLAMRPLQEASARGLGIIVSRHERKSGGETGDSARGSSAFTGAVDIVVTLRRTEGSSPNVRVLRAISRFDETPPEFSLEWREGRFHAIGPTAAPYSAKAREALLAELRTDGNGVTIDDIAERLHISRATLSDAANALRSEGIIDRTGKGARGDPHRWHLINSDSPTAVIPRGGE